MNVTADQVRDAAIAAGVQTVDQHQCSLCDCMVVWRIIDEHPYFDPSCGCGSEPLQPRTWQAAAEWINMQTVPEQAKRIAAAFGLTLEE